MRKQLYILLILLSGWGYAQDIHFSQWTNTPLIVNPGLTGAEGDQRAFLNYRNQWQSVTTPYRTFAASFESSVFREKTGENKLTLGGYVSSDKAGDLNLANNLLLLATSYRLTLAENAFLTAGIQGGIGNTSIQTENARWDNQFNGTYYDPSVAPSTDGSISPSSSIIGDYAAGLLFTYSTNNATLSSLDEKLLRIGGAVYHINRPKLFNERTYIRYTGHAEGFIGIKNSVLALHPALYLMINRQSYETLTGTYLKYLLQENSKYTGIIKGAALVFGVFYRYRDAIIPGFGIEYGSYAMYISYDINVSGLTPASHAKGGLEISLCLINPNPFSKSVIKRKSVRFL